MQTTPSDAQTPSQASCGGPEASQTLRAGSDLIFHRVCPADQIEEGVGRPITLDGTHLALFRHEDVLHAVDNRCPHMGYPMSEGSVRDGILVCHWHHWEFDVKTGGCLLSGGDDLSTFPVEVRDDGYL